MVFEEPFMTVKLPFLPPSTNHAYVTTPSIMIKGKVVKHGGRHLSEEGERFKNDAKHWLSQNALPYLTGVTSDQAYWVRYVILMPAFNKGYPKTAQTRFKKLDATNRVKLLEDTLAEIAGIDDANFFDVQISKRHSEENSVIIQLGLVTELELCMKV